MDLIDRQAAIDAHCELCGDRDKCNCDICPDVEVLQLLPSAQPVDKDINVPANDLISRQAAIEALKRAEALTRAFGYHHVIKTIRELSSVQPEPKTGRWMIMETAYEDTEAKCSECGFVTLVNEPGNGLHMLSDLRFCPNCGAKMEGKVFIRGREDDERT